MQIAYLNKKESQFYLCCFLPVRPTFLRHIKQRFFLGFGGSGALNSSLPAVEGWEAENVGWLKTEETQEKYTTQWSCSLTNLHRRHTWAPADCFCKNEILSVNHILQLWVYSQEVMPTIEIIHACITLHSTGIQCWYKVHILSDK